MDEAKPGVPRNAHPHIPFPTSGSYPARGGNLVRPLVDGIPAYRRICGAVEAARHSVWVTATFVAPDFPMPDDRGTFLDVLDRAAARGLDVRALLWRPNPEASHYGQSFAGSPADRDLLCRRGSRFRIRWDRADAAFCQHQKSWVIDAGQPTETSFVGGINLTPRNLGAPGHENGDQYHDAYVEITGPSATDVQHNFVQRWNEASERHEADGLWGHDGADDLPIPTRPSARQGDSLVQIQRMVRAGRYRDGRPSPGGRPYDIADGERSIFDQYCQAIDAARNSIYIENQALPVPEIAVKLEEALRRGVDVSILAPADPERHVYAARRDPAEAPFFDRIEALGRFANFSLVGIAARTSRGARRNIYVHGKIMLVDDAWATIGSCNLHWNSLFGHSELNASFWDPEVVRALRCALLAEHTGQDTAHLDDRAALRLYGKIAQENRRRREAGDCNWQGLAFSLDPATYGE